MWNPRGFVYSIDCPADLDDLALPTTSKMSMKTSMTVSASTRTLMVDVGDDGLVAVRDLYPDCAFFPATRKLDRRLSDILAWSLSLILPIVLLGARLRTKRLHMSHGRISFVRLRANPSRSLHGKQWEFHWECFCFFMWKIKLGNIKMIGAAYDSFRWLMTKLSLFYRLIPFASLISSCIYLFMYRDWLTCPSASNRLLH